MRTQLGAPSWIERNIAVSEPQNQALWGMVRKYTGHPLFLDFLSQLIDIYDVRPRDPEALVKMLQDYSVNYIKFFREDPERFQSPMRTVVWGLGDCDDKAIFIAAGTRTFRIPTRLQIIRMSIQGRRIGHVYPEVFIDGEWIPVESVRAYPWGHDPSMIAQKRGFLTSKETVGDVADTGVYA